MKSKIRIIESVFSVFFCVLIFSVLSFFTIKTTYNDYVLIKGNECITGTIENVIKKKKGNYLIEVSYKKNEETFTGKFYTKKKLTEYFGDFFSTKYRTGSRILLLVGEGQQVLPYSEKKSIIIKDIVNSVIVLSFLIFFIFVLLNKKIYQLEEDEYDIKESICDIFNIFSFMCFFACGFLFFLQKNLNIALFFGTCGFILFTLPEILIMKKIHLKGYETSFDENPGLFIFGCIIYIFVTALLIYVNILIAH